MGKNNKGLLWLLAGGAAIYLLMPEKVKETFGNGGGLTSISLSNLFGKGLFDLPGILGGGTSEIPIPEMPDWWKDLFSGPPVPETPAPTPTAPGQPRKEDPDITPGAGPSAILEALRKSIAVTGKQYTGAALAGTHLIKPLPGATTIQKASKPLTELAEQALKRAGLKTGAKIGARAVPVLGWGLLGVDLIADIVRLFGVDVTEWLGFSPIAGALTGGKNPLEEWVAETAPGIVKPVKERGLPEGPVEAETGYATTVIPKEEYVPGVW